MNKIFNDTTRRKFTYEHVELVVRITGVTSPQAWYANCVGTTYRVYEWGSGYVVKEDYINGPNYPWRHILPADCEIVTNASNTKL